MKIEQFYMSIVVDEPFDVVLPYDTESLADYNICMGDIRVHKVVQARSKFRIYDNILYLCDKFRDEKFKIFQIKPASKIMYSDDDHVRFTKRAYLMRRLTFNDIWALLETTIPEFIKSYDIGIKKKIISIGRPEDIHRFVRDDSWKVRKLIVDQCTDEDLDILVKDTHWKVRNAVAKLGKPKYLDRLIYDTDIDVRKTVCSFGRDKDLDILVDDEWSSVRQAVARHGRPKDLAKLVYDTDKYVRVEVARHKNCSEELINVLLTDPEYCVRYEVARRRNYENLLFLSAGRHRIPYEDIEKFSANLPLICRINLTITHILSKLAD